MSGAGNPGGIGIPGSAYGAIRSADPNSNPNAITSRRSSTGGQARPFHPLPAQSIRSCDDIPSEWDKSSAVWISLGLFLLIWLGLPASFVAIIQWFE